MYAIKKRSDNTYFKGQLYTGNDRWHQWVNLEDARIWFNLSTTKASITKLRKFINHPKEKEDLVIAELKYTEIKETEYCPN